MAATFNCMWLTHPDFATWVKSVDGDPHMAYCQLCRKSIFLSNMGKRALASHSQSKKHKASSNKQCSQVDMRSHLKPKKPPTSIEEITDSRKIEGEEASVEFITTGGKCSASLDAPNDDGFHDLRVPPPPECPADKPDRVQQQAAGQIPKYMQMKEARKAEILWALKCVTSHYSFKHLVCTVEVCL
jgi:hypothetical protein